MSGKFRSRCHYVKNQGFQITSPIPARRDCGGRQQRMRSSARASQLEQQPLIWSHAHPAVGLRARSSHLTHGGLRGRLAASRADLSCLSSEQQKTQISLVGDNYRSSPPKHSTQRNATGRGDLSTRDVPGRIENSGFTRWIRSRRADPALGRRRSR